MCCSRKPSNSGSARSLTRVQPFNAEVTEDAHEEEGTYEESESDSDVYCQSRGKSIRCQSASSGLRNLSESSRCQTSRSVNREPLEISVINVDP